VQPPKSCTGYQSHSKSRTNCAHRTQRLHRSYALLDHRFPHTSSQHSNTQATACLQLRRSSSTANREANRGPCIFHGCTSCMESSTHRIQTDAVIGNNFLAPTEDVFIFHCVLTMECAISLCRRHTRNAAVTVTCREWRCPHLTTLLTLIECNPDYHQNLKKNFFCSPCATFSPNFVKIGLK